MLNQLHADADGGRDNGLATGFGRTLHSRHVAMISIGGIIGAGLFVGSSAAIAAIGPAIPELQSQPITTVGLIGILNGFYFVVRKRRGDPF
ncbi:MAG: hypothetical protein J0I19_09645 [Alphaproteobacteria bacterium]|nr:hypothetical protein [Alphaproteobacteria bacterium]